MSISERKNYSHLREAEGREKAIDKLISIIIPIHNVAPYLHRCVDSALNQSYKNLEIMLIDDGSSDESGKICDEYAFYDDRIRVCHKEQGGLSDARNAGIMRATGDYIYFLDGDDYIGERLLENAYNAISKEDADVCCWGYTRISEKGDILSSQSYEKGEFVIEANKEKFEFLTMRYLKERCGSTAWSRLYKSNIIHENNLLFEDNLTVQGEDTLFNMRYLLYAKKVCVIDETAYYYRLRANSLSLGLKRTELGRYHRSMTYLWTYLADMGMQEFQESFHIIYGIFMLDGWRYLHKSMGIDEVRAQMNEVENGKLADMWMGKILNNRKEMIRFCGVIRGRLCLRMVQMISSRKRWYDIYVYQWEEILLRLSVMLHRWRRKLC